MFSTSHGAAFTTVDYIWYTPQASQSLWGLQICPAACVSAFACQSEDLLVPLPEHGCLLRPC